jgi:hypothetical protein
VIDTPKQWLGGVPWDSVVTINKALCQAQKIEPANNAGAYDRVRKVWETAVLRRMKLAEVLDVCRECHEARPFTFNNANTFASIARTLVDDWLKHMPPVECQIIRTTVAHYVAALVNRKELLQILKHFDRFPQPVTATVSPKTDTTTVALRPQEQRAAM